MPGMKKKVKNSMMGMKRGGKVKKGMKKRTKKKDKKNKRSLWEKTKRLSWQESQRRFDRSYSEIKKTRS